MPRVRITETSPPTVWICNAPGEPKFARELGEIRQFKKIDWTNTKNAPPHLWQKNNKVKGIEFDLLP